MSSISREIVREQEEEKGQKLFSFNEAKYYYYYIYGANKHTHATYDTYFES